MAITIENVQTGAWNASTSVTITKPTGLAEGDLLLAFIAGIGGVDTPSGWTLETTYTQSNVNVAVLWKIATSGDVAASDFTFTTSSTGEDASAGVLYRISDAGSSLEVYDSGGTTDTISDSGPDSVVSIGSQSITTLSQTNLLFMIGFFQDADGVSGFGSQSITGITNPTWTTRFSTSITPVATVYWLAVSDASTTNAGTISAFQFALTSNNGTTTVQARLLSVVAQADASFSVALIDPATTFPAPTGGVTADATVALLNPATTMNNVSASSAAPAFTNSDKNAASFTNLDKS